MNDQSELIKSLETELELVIANQPGLSELEEMLAVHINELIKKDFQKLLSILYRIDVSESKLRMNLDQQTGADAGLLIARLIIERQLQKIESRKKSNPYSGEIDDTEKW